MAPPLDPIGALRNALRGRYDIEREIGQGAFATVYLAQDLKHERKVALKVLHADPTSDTGELRFIREIRVLAGLQHPNILPLHDSGHVDALLYYVMPYVAGETLRDRINRERQLEVTAAFRIAREAADALAYAHGQGIIHRDIKPENILLSAGHPMLADFGIARAIDLAGVKQLTRTGTGSPGTPAYMSPEQLMGDRELDGRSDIYSLGCVLYEMLAGKPPFTGKEGFVKRFTDTAPTVSSVRRDVPPWVDRVVGTALERAQNDRYQTAYEFATELARRSGVRDRFAPYTNVTPASAAPPAAEAPADIERVAAVNPREAKRAAREAARAARALRGPSIVDRNAPRSTPGEHAARSTRINKRRAVISAIGGVLRKPLIMASGVGVIVVTALVAAPAARRLISPDNPIDTTRFVIIPSAVAPRSNSDHINQKLYEALGVWKGLRLVSDAAVDDAIRDAGGPPASLAEALRIARRLGAGRMVWTRSVSGPTRRVRGELFDVVTGASSGRFAVLSDSATDQEFARAALTLVALPGRMPLGEDGDGLTNSFDSWTAYNRGHIALSQWKLPEAAKLFAEAATADPAFPVAQLWLAQIQSWTNAAASAEWGARAANAIRDTRLNERDQTIARALVALAEKRYPAGCEAYRRLTDSRGVDFIGWYGLGECQSLDSVVVPSASSPSGWRFRSSYRAAAAGYMRALEIEPRAHSIFSFTRLKQLIPASAAKVRAGRSDPPKSQIFVAYPSLEGTSDTLGFIPYPLSRFTILPISAIRTHNAALNANTELLTQFTTAWTRQLPNDPAAFAARAEILEISGDIGGNPFEATAVMRALRQVRALTQNPQQVFHTAVKEVWLRFKRDEFGQARWLADSLLSANPHPTVSEAEELLPLGALTGKLEKTLELGRVSQPFLPASEEEVPAQIRYVASELLITAALGVCGDRISNLEQRLDQALVRYLPTDRAQAMRGDLMARPLSLTAHCDRGQSALRISQPRMRLYQIQQAYAKGDLKLTRTLLDLSATVASRDRPGDKSLDYAFQEAWVRAAIGDTAIAIRLLDDMLGALPSFSAENLKEVGAAAASAQAMVLRSRLAQARNDTKTARQWAGAASLLWATADPVVRATADDVWPLSRNPD